MSTCNSYALLISNDGFRFYLDPAAALQSPILKQLVHTQPEGVSLDIPASVLLIVCRYLEYQYLWGPAHIKTTTQARPPPPVVPPKLGVAVALAARYLQL
ncbi:s-phase kinase-associated protein 1-like protein [Kipferlia bialata]|uniref:S-phase kinase-associated protein 1-like protein n=1 Tax=Kipferlia bialata TaxID=797122 RepID=A0A9K3CVA1_9EUKA|nr:S-phase kinase-associated protein 1-like protein [Kipferlia bialata]GIQ84678.1 s-phase kinase-associated protein 1-like protein [Kipferlia bialata]|eukprot:g3960.t1